MKTMRMVLSALALLGLTAVDVAADAPQPADTPPTEAPVRNASVWAAYACLACTWGQMG